MRPFETSLFPRVHWTWGRIHRRDWWWTSSHNIRWGGDNAYHQQKEDTNIFLQKLWKRKKSFAPLSFFFCTLDARQCIITRVHNNSKDFSRKKKGNLMAKKLVNLSFYTTLSLSLSLSLSPPLSPPQPKTANDILSMLEIGNRNRTQHPTDANATSSRSHAVFQVSSTWASELGSCASHGKICCPIRLQDT